LGPWRQAGRLPRLCPDCRLQNAAAGRAKAAKANAKAADLKPIFDRIGSDGPLSLRQMAAMLTVEGIPMPAGGAKWTAVQARQGEATHYFVRVRQGEPADALATARRSECARTARRPPLAAAASRCVHSARIASFRRAKKGAERYS
jgi:hypothetical protein